MKLSQTIMIAADLSDMDFRLMEAAKWLSDLGQPEKLYVLHVNGDS
ncbi:MAG: hypothetical protein AAF587_30720 [Bacteroidota bacterium]